MHGRHKDGPQSLGIAAARRIQLQAPRLPTTLFVGFKQSMAEIAKLVVFSILQRTLGRFSQKYRVIRFMQSFGAVQREKHGRAGPSRGNSAEQDVIRIKCGKPRYVGSTTMRVMQNDDGLRFQPAPPGFRHAFLNRFSALNLEIKASTFMNLDLDSRSSKSCRPRSKIQIRILSWLSALSERQ